MITAWFGGLDGLDESQRLSHHEPGTGTGTGTATAPVIAVACDTPPVSAAVPVADNLGSAFSGEIVGTTWLLASRSGSTLYSLLSCN